MKRLLIALNLLTISLLTACGGGGGFSGDELTGKLVLDYRGTQVPLARISYTTASDSTARATSSAGEFDYTNGENVTFTVGSARFTTAGASNISADSLASGNADIANNVKRLLISLDQDGNPANGITMPGNTDQLDPTAPSVDFIRQFTQLTGSAPKALFSPMLGINLEAAQGESDSVGQPMPFVDIFRTARPFTELTVANSFAVDENGWPTTISPNTAYARTKMLQGVPKGAIPDGVYTLIYEGDGTVEFSGNAIKSVQPYNTSVAGVKGNLLTLTLSASTDTEANAIGLLIRGDRSDVKNIRLVMPGGTCRNNITNQFNNFIRVNSQAECPAGSTYIPFADRLLADRNAMVFNPAYLSFLKDFKVVRMMNLMEASPGVSSCQDNAGIVDLDCVQQPYPWQDRAMMDDAVWGGSSRTPADMHKGVPVEVLVELANQLGADPWFNMHYAVNDDYVENFASYVHANLRSDLKPYVEYSNETWNPGFLGYYYVREQGIDAGLNTVPDLYNSTSRDANYFARLRYYSRRSVEIFQIWSSYFGSRMERVMGSFQGDTILSEQLLQFENAPGNVDALAIAPYFFGCVDNTGSCGNAPKTLSQVNNTDDIFNIIDQPYPTDPNALDATLVKIGNQANIAAREGVDLITYEGGQHLTIMGSMGSLSNSRKAELRSLFRAANRDPRMKQRYLTLLNGWREQAPVTTLFTLYTLPQTYYQYGNWGLKEDLGKTRAESPKYDAAMDFQEQQGQCWWDCRE